MSILIALLAGLSVTTLVVGVFRSSGVSTNVRRRAERLWLAVPVQSGDEPFATRVLRPMAESFMRAASRLLPRTLVTSVHQQLETAALRVSPAQFIARWVVFGIVPAVAFSLFLVSASALSTTNLLMAGAWLGLGGYGPIRWLRLKAERRTKVIDRELPDAIDLIVTSVEAGLSVQQAMMTVAEKFSGAIGEEFGRVNAETNIGRTRTEALTEMATRTGSRDLMLFVRAITQAEEMGLAIGGVLRNQSAEIRERRQQRAREQAAKIPVKMTIPTVLLMLPTLFILILAPVVLNAMDSFGG
jgi:tight adherence protein C